MDRFKSLLFADHLQWVNRYLPWRSPIGVMIFALLVSLLCAQYVHTSALLITWILLGLLAFGIIWPLLTLAAVSAELRFASKQAFEGDAVEVYVRITNRLPIPFYGMTIEGAWSRDSDGPETRQAGILAVVSIPAWRTDNIVLSFRPNARGIYPASMLKLSCRFPFNLYTFRKLLPCPRQMVVYPKRCRVREFSDSVGPVRFDGEHESQKPGTMGDVTAVRPYQHGDSLRRVHWRLTARCDRLIVCEQQAPTVAQLLLVVDVDPQVHLGDVNKYASDGSREWAIRLAYNFIVQGSQRGTKVSLLLGDQLIEGMQAKLLDALVRISDDPADAVNSTPTLKSSKSESARLVITTPLGLARMTDLSQAIHEQIVLLHPEIDPNFKSMESSPSGKNVWWSIDSLAQLSSESRLASRAKQSPTERRASARLVGTVA